MSDRPSHNLDGLDVDLTRRIDEICLRFEADWRDGRQPRIDDYLVDVSHEGRPALRAELETLEGELRQSKETVARPDSGPATAPEAEMVPNLSTIAESPTIAPRPPPTTPCPGEASSLVQEEATVPPRNPPQSPHDQPTALLLGQGSSATSGTRTLPHPLFRRLRDSPRDRPRRHGRRLPCAAGQPQPHSCASR